MVILKKGVLACQGNKSTNFPLSLLIGLTWAYFSLDFYLNNTELCRGIRTQQSILLIIISALIVNLLNFVTV